MKRSFGLAKLCVVLWLAIGWQETLQAQSFFGIPLFDGDSPDESGTSPASDSELNAAAKTADQLPSELVELWSEYRRERAAGLYKVNSHYLLRLEALKRGYSGEGNLEGAMATKREIERVTAESSALEDGIDLPPLRMENRESSSLPEPVWEEYEAQMDLKFRGITILSQRLIESVDSLKLELTRRDKLDAAVTCGEISAALAQEIASMATAGEEGSKGAIGTTTLGLTSTPQEDKPLREQLAGTRWRGQFPASHGSKTFFMAFDEEGEFVSYNVRESNFACKRRLRYEDGEARFNIEKPDWVIERTSDEGEKLHIVAGAGWRLQLELDD